MMTIGIDLRIFQIGHQYRGIGSHIKNLIRELSEYKSKPKLVLYEYPNVDSGIEVIGDYLKKFDYEIRKTKSLYTGPSFLRRELQSFKQRYFDGDSGLINFDDVDVMLCVDFNLGVPKNKFVSTLLISYDMIPWVLSEHYLPGFFRTLSRTKQPRKSIKAGMERVLYFNKIKQANMRANKIISISEHTKKDLIKYLKINPTKIQTVLLGINPVSNKSLKSTIKCKTIKNKNVTFNLKSSPYVFFMGGADRRRRIETLIEAVDMLNSDGEDVNLILAGFDFQSIKTVPDAITSDAISKCNNKEKIYFAGFINDDERNALFKYSKAFVFPSVYEGFGLPILESLDLECPVITFNNSSIYEVGGDAVLYANNSKGIASSIKSLNDDKIRKNLISKGLLQVKNFSWEKTAKETMEALESISK